ncbi:MAG: twin-arginine translocase subunit TatC [Christensenellales bacterium]|jgi:sec-independent protein translocase protein TatC
MAKNNALSVPDAAAPPAKQSRPKVPPDGAKMSLAGHLVEIKTRLTRVILTFIAGVVLCSFFVEAIITELINKGEGFSFVTIAAGELVGSYVKIVLIAALVLSGPVILYQIWGFVRPALEEHEKRMGLFALLGGTGFFILGVLFAYFVAAPFTLQFFANFDTTGLVKTQVSIQSYIDFMITTLVTFGLVFEMPMLTLFLSQLGIIKPKFLIKTRKYAILIIAILAAILTPPDVVSQITIAVPMLVLYEISIVVCRMIEKRKEQKKAAQAA